MALARAETYPERGRRSPGKSILDPFIPYLQRRSHEGCSNSNQLWREIQAQGYSGSRSLVGTWVQYYRTSSSPSTPHRYLAQPTLPMASLPVPRQLVWYLLRSSDDLTPEEGRVCTWIRLHPQVECAYRLGRHFQRMFHDHCAADFDAWLQACLTSTLPELRTFATSLQREEPSIRLALSLPWNNGVAEGHVNRLKLIKRTLYGPASFDLLRLRVLSAA